jgi:predicted nuclease of predicted toxin-antitoxin system
LKEKFKLDENLPEAALELFRKNDFDAANVREEQLADATDEWILMVCGNENRVLVTQDLDFSDITLLSRTEIPGIIIFRLKTQSREAVLEALEKLIPLRKKNSATGKIMM